MAGIEENSPVIGDWTPINPSPRTLFSDFLVVDLSPRPFPDDPAGNGSGGALAGVEMPKGLPGLKEEDGEMGMEDSCDDPFSQLDVFSAPERGPRGGLAERMARAGFTAPKLNTARIRSASMASSSLEVRSPYLTIPPGLSPTTLLDSPVFLSNSLVQPSPTTGKFPLDLPGNMSSASVSSISDKNKDTHLSNVGTEFVFKPHPRSSASYFPNTASKVASVDHQQSFPNGKLPVQPEAPNHEYQDTVDVHAQNPQDFKSKSGFPCSSEQKDGAGDLSLDQNVSDSIMGDEPLDDQQDGEGENKGEFSSVPVSAPSEDGYNWRKYGQKQVKGSEYPRSYYKCTHPNCQVRKKVERSYEGHVTEIIYKGVHNHPKPPPNRRSAVPTSHPFSEMSIDGSEIHASQPTLNGKLAWDNAQNGTVGSDRNNDGLEVTSSATITAEFCDTSSIQAQYGRHYGSADAIDVSSNVSNDEDDDDQATHGSASLGCDGAGDESESKRRKLESSAMDMSAGSRAVREPRVVVQTTSEVDILDDGYRWRKYGQKVVKGNPNPRSYYKCTNPGCNVRKHVERASHDLKSVITTYEGKHNHDVPAARNSSHTSVGPSSMAAVPASQAHNTHERPELPQDSLQMFNTPPPVGSFALLGREQQVGPVSGFSFGAGHHGLSNLAMAGLGPATQMKMLPTVHPHMGLRHVNEAAFMMPKSELKEEPMPEGSLSMPNGPAVYRQILSRLPMGRQL